VCWMCVDAGHVVAHHPLSSPCFTRIKQKRSLWIHRLGALRLSYRSDSLPAALLLAGGGQTDRAHQQNARLGRVGQSRQDDTGIPWSGSSGDGIHDIQHAKQHILRLLDPGDLLPWGRSDNIRGGAAGSGCHCASITVHFEVAAGQGAQKRQQVQRACS